MNRNNQKNPFSSFAFGVLLVSLAFLAYIPALDNGFVWDTAYGTRPKEDLVFPPGTYLNGEDVSGQDRTVCAYRTLGDAVEGSMDKCLPILGGERWYESEHRIPILDREQRGGQEIYKVVLPLVGTGAQQADEEQALLMAACGRGFCL